MWARPLAAVVVVASGLCLVAVLALGMLWATTDWTAFECWLGDEPACDEPREESRLSSVRASSWLLAAIGLSSFAASGVRAWKVREPRQLLPVAGLGAVTVAVAVVLLGRL